MITVPGGASALRADREAPAPGGPNRDLSPDRKTPKLDVADDSAVQVTLMQA